MVLDPQGAAGKLARHARAGRNVGATERLRFSASSSASSRRRVPVRGGVLDIRSGQKLAWDNKVAKGFNPKLRVLKMPRPPLACAFAPSLPAVSGYFFSARGMAAPMRSKASFWRLVGVVRTGTAAGVSHSVGLTLVVE